MTVQLLSTKD